MWYDLCMCGETRMLHACEENEIRGRSAADVWESEWEGIELALVLN